MHIHRLTTVAICLLLACGRFAAAQSKWTIWRVPPGESGDWFSEANWTAGLPSSDTAAAIVNGSVARIDSGVAEADSLHLFHTFGGTVEQSGGQVEVANRVNILNGVFNMTGGQLDAASLGLPAANTVFLLPNLSGVPLPDSGTDCPLGGDGPCVPLTDVFRASSRQFVLDGGIVDISGAVEIGQSQLKIADGQFTADRMLVDAFGWINSNPEATQTGGVVSINGDLAIQDGTYAFSAGKITAGRLVMGDPADSMSWVVTSRTPEFIQAGGSLHVLNNLELCEPGFIWRPIEPIAPFTDVTYRLEAGTLSVDGDAVVGSLGAAPARFLQSGGAASVAGTLRVEGDESRVEISGGDLRVGILEIGTNVFNEGGTLAIASPAASLTVDTRVTLGGEALLEVADTASLKLDGGSFEILGELADNLAGLADLALTIEGGDEWSSLEAASLDQGNSSAAFLHNFALGELKVGGETFGHLRLVDLVDNQTTAETIEAVYVDHLVVGPGSTLDLGGLNIYFRTADISGQLITSGGTMLAAVPEPAAAVLILVTVAIYWTSGSGMRGKRVRPAPGSNAG